MLEKIEEKTLTVEEVADIIGLDEYSLEFWLEVNYLTKANGLPRKKEIKRGWMKIIDDSRITNGVVDSFKDFRITIKGLHGINRMVNRSNLVNKSCENGK
jgi:phage antirepressor YoqD-like protein